MNDAGRGERVPRQTTFAENLASYPRSGGDSVASNRGAASSFIAPISSAYRRFGLASSRRDETLGGGMRRGAPSRLPSIQRNVFLFVRRRMA
jgi:hypothetical protein